MNKRDFNVVGNEGTDNQELAKGIAFVKSFLIWKNLLRPSQIWAYGSILLKSVRCQLLYLMQRILDANGVLW